MHLIKPLASRPGSQTIHILRDEVKIIAQVLFQLYQSLMSTIGLNTEALRVAFLVELPYQDGIAHESFGTGDILDLTILPEAASISKCSYPRFG